MADVLCEYCEKLFIQTVGFQRFCSRKCKENFRKNGKRSNSLVQQMNEDRIERSRKDEEQYKRSRRIWKEKAKLRSKFIGITSHSKQVILEYRKNATHCDLCGDEANFWCADHDHSTGKFRGVICAPCNKGLGNFRDSVEKLQKAIKYLQNHLRDEGGSE